MKEWNIMSVKERDVAISSLLQLPICKEEGLAANALYTGETATSFRFFTPATNLQNAMEVELKIMQMDFKAQMAYIGNLQLITTNRWNNCLQNHYVIPTLRTIHAPAEDRARAAYQTLKSLPE